MFWTILCIGIIVFIVVKVITSINYNAEQKELQRQAGISRSNDAINGAASDCNQQIKAFFSYRSAPDGFRSYDKL